MPLNNHLKNMGPCRKTANDEETWQSFQFPDRTTCRDHLYWFPYKVEVHLQVIKPTWVRNYSTFNSFHPYFWRIINNVTFTSHPPPSAMSLQLRWNLYFKAGKFGIYHLSLQHGHYYHKKDAPPGNQWIAIEKERTIPGKHKTFSWRKVPVGQLENWRITEVIWQQVHLT